MVVCALPPTVPNGRSAMLVVIVKSHQMIVPPDLVGENQDRKLALFRARDPARSDALGRRKILRLYVLLLMPSKDRGIPVVGKMAVALSIVLTIEWPIELQD
jgi:hypothetical protein